MALILAVFSTGILPTATAYATPGQDVCPDDSFVVGVGGWDKTDSINALSWDIPEKSGYTVTDVCYKASNTVVYPDPITDPITSTVWNKDGCIAVGNPNGCNYQNISHASVYYTPVAPTPVTAGVVTYVDLCGTANDTYTVPATPNVTYSVAAGTHAGAGAVTVTATANTGYVLTAPYTFNYTFTNVACPPQQVTAGIVTYSDLCGTSNDTYTVPVTPNVTYSVATGTHAGSGTVTVTATANPGYVLTAPYTFSHTFTNVACPLTPVTAGVVTYSDACGTANDSYTVPTTANVTYSVAAGTYPATGTVTVTATANTGYVLTAPYTFSHTFTNGECEGDNDNKYSICHATGNDNNDKFVLIKNISAAGIYNGHMGDSHQNGDDIIPPFSYKGQTYSQNWPSGQAFFDGGCKDSVETEAPKFKDFCGEKYDVLKIPDTEGVVYSVNGEKVSSGWMQAPAANVTVTAVAEDGYVLAAGSTTSWSYEYTNENCLTITKSANLLTDTNKDGVIGVGDKVTWTITVTNNGTKWFERFDVVVTDEGAVIENDGVIEGLAPGESVTLEAYTFITAADISTVCKATNTASFEATYSRYELLSETREETIVIDEQPKVDFSGTVDAEALFNCPTPGRGADTPPTPGQTLGTSTTAAAAAVLPATLPATGGEQNPLMIILASLLAYGAAYFLQGRRNLARNQA